MKRFITLSLWVLPILLLNSSGVAANDMALDLLLEEDLRSMQSEVREKEKNKKKLTALVAKFSSEQFSVADSSPNLTPMSHVTDAANNIVQAADTQNILPDVQAYLEALNRVFTPLSTGTSQITNFIDEEFVSYNADYQNTVIDRIRNKLYQTNIDFVDALIQSGEPIFTVFDIQYGLTGFYADALYYDVNYDVVSKNTSSAEMAVLIKVINTDIAAQYQLVVTKHKELLEMKKALISQFLNEELTVIEQDIGALNQKLANSIKTYKTMQETEARKAQTDQSLVWAVYGMITVLLLLFLGLKVFTDAVAISLIENRSLVEVVGMAFMLITIIILGTGQKISSEIIGTLLGTIAGYVFARNTEDKPDNKKRVNK